MNRKIELLAPGGDIEAIKAAISAGANAVYCGLDFFNARNRATNLSQDELNGAIRLAHKYDCKVFLTLNVVILEHEIPVLVRLLNQIVNSKIDGIIVQDLGIFHIVKKYFPTLDIHSSTQMTTHNEGQIQFVNKIGASRVTLSRELNLTEIKSLTALAHLNGMLSEVFVHGALCIAFSGQCYFSSVSNGNSGNRGRCNQPCRDEYEETASGYKYPLNLKDNSSYFDLPELVDAQVDSLKIEGRIKGAHYVYTVVDTWKKQIDTFIASGDLVGDDSNLHKVFNRNFTNSYLTGNISKDMFIDNPRDHSAKHAIESKSAISKAQIANVYDDLCNDRHVVGTTLTDKIKDLNIDKVKLTIKFTAILGEPLTVTANTNTNTFVVKSLSSLASTVEASITDKILETRFKIFNNATYILAPLDFTKLNEQLNIPFKEITAMKNQLAFLLNGSVDVVPPIEIPKLVQNPKIEKTPKLSIIISDEKDAYLSESTDADIYFKLPDSFKKGCTKQSDILLRNPRLIPWFPAVLIGPDYIEAVNILKIVKPTTIVSNNTGIAFKAFEMGIKWIAGPFLNTTNSHALMTLKEELNCTGAFISNEINRNQMRNIKRPKNFKLMHSIYHPILMMTSRQCLFQRTVGCSKLNIDDDCMLYCENSTTITNMKGTPIVIDKRKNGYTSIYNLRPFLNLDVVRDLSELFDEFCIDLTEFGPKVKLDKALLIQEFKKFLADPNRTKETLKDMITTSTNKQYNQGL